MNFSMIHFTLKILLLYQLVFLFIYGFENFIGSIVIFLFTLVGNLVIYIESKNFKKFTMEMHDNR